MITGVDTNNMNYKEYLNHLKEHDPMTYHEMTSNPTGADGTDFSITGLLFIITLIMGIGLMLYGAITFFK